LNLSLHDALTGLSICYENPADWRLDTETVEVTAPSAVNLHGDILFEGGTWVHPAWRGRDFAYLLARSGRAVSVLADWRWSSVIGFLRSELAEKDFATRYGMPRGEPSIKWKGSRFVDVGTWYLLWQSREESDLDIARFLQSAWFRERVAQN
jgi:hypothetical protein